MCLLQQTQTLGTSTARYQNRILLWRQQKREHIHWDPQWLAPLAAQQLRLAELKAAEERRELTWLNFASFEERRQRFEKLRCALRLNTAQVTETFFVYRNNSPSNSVTAPRVESVFCARALSSKFGVSKWFGDRVHRASKELGEPVKVKDTCHTLKGDDPAGETLYPRVGRHFANYHLPHLTISQVHRARPTELDMPVALSFGLSAFQALR